MSPHVVHVVVTDSFAGVERYVATAATGLCRRGWTVSVIGGEAGLMNSGPEPGFAHYEVTGILSTARQLARCRPVDLVHAHLTSAELAATVSAPLLRAAVLTTRHFAARRGSTLRGQIVAPLIRGRLAVQLAPSRYVADLTREDCRVLFSGVPNIARSDDPRDRTILVLQRLEPEKSTDVAVSAFAASGLAQSGWRLVVAGRGSLEAALRTQAHESGLRDSVDFVGFVRDPSELLARASMLLAPRADEAFGLSVAEAMAVGLPVVAAGSGAHPELLGAGGWMFPPGDSCRAAKLLRHLAEDAELASAYGEELRSRQQELFSLDAHLDGLERVYRDVLTRR